MYIVLFVHFFPVYLLISLLNLSFINRLEPWYNSMEKIPFIILCFFPIINIFLLIGLFKGFDFSKLKPKFKSQA
jgi:hypothetical protein